MKSLYLITAIAMSCLICAKIAYSLGGLTTYTKDGKVFQICDQTFNQTINGVQYILCNTPVRNETLNQVINDQKANPNLEMNETLSSVEIGTNWWAKNHVPTNGT